MNILFKKDFWEDVWIDLVCEAHWVLHVIIVMIIPIACVINVIIYVLVYVLIAWIFDKEYAINTQGLDRIIIIFVVVEIICILILSPKFFKVFSENLKRRN